MSNELRLLKWVRCFEQNCTVKCIIFFASFCWLLDFLLENLKLKKSSGDIHWNIWTNIKLFYARNNIFKKRIPNMRFLNHLYLGPNFVSWGTALGRFQSSTNHGGRHICSAPNHNKASNGPEESKLRARFLCYEFCDRVPNLLEKVSIWSVSYDKWIFLSNLFFKHCLLLTCTGKKFLYYIKSKQKIKLSWNHDITLNNAKF